MAGCLRDLGWKGCRGRRDHPSIEKWGAMAWSVVGTAEASAGSSLELG